MKFTPCALQPTTTEEKSGVVGTLSPPLAGQINNDPARRPAIARPILFVPERRIPC
jgi:hypothetical protein